MPEPRLEINDSLGRRIVTVEKLPFAIGRRVGSDLHLPSAEVSRDHAEILTDGDGYAIRDRGSRYGTFVNDTQIEQQPLANGDRIRLGRSTGAEITFLSTPAGQTTDRSAAAVGELRQLATLLEGLRALSSARVVDDVLRLVMDSAIEVSGAERGFIMLADDAGVLEFTMGRSRNRETLPGSGFETSRKIPEEVFTTGQPRIEVDLLDGDLPNQHMGTIALGIRNVLCVPLRLVRYTSAQDAAQTDGGRIGVLYLDSREKGTLLSPSTAGALETLANEAAVAIENAKLYRSALEKAKLEQEMRTAAEIQQALLPASRRSGRFFDAAAEMVPCRAIGGDFFDYIDLPEEGFGFALGDVAGKGPPAALLGAMLQGSLTAQAFASVGPAATMSAVNTALVRRGIQGRFVTLFYGVLFPDGRLTYCNAGHNAPMLVTGGDVQRLETGGMVLGIFDSAAFEEASVTLKPGDFLVTFSDGVSEALSEEGEEYGDDRLLSSIADMTDVEVEPRLKHVLASVSAFTAGAAQSDDVTAMIVGYRSPQDAAAASSE
jgi:sigma-B regulation protein RsbU (phosphoserine phosphatase)